MPYCTFLDHDRKNYHDVYKEAWKAHGSHQNIFICVPKMQGASSLLFMRL